MAQGEMFRGELRAGPWLPQFSKRVFAFPRSPFVLQYPLKAEEAGNCQPELELIVTGSRAVLRPEGLLQLSAQLGRLHRCAQTATPQSGHCHTLPFLLETFISLLITGTNGQGEVKTSLPL